MSRRSPSALPARSPQGVQLLTATHPIDPEPRRLTLGGFTAPLVCARIPADLLILLCGMTPSPGELFDDWWKNAGYEQSGFDDVFYHDLPPQLAAEAQRRERNEDSKALREPWPLDS
jgi:hypothetical protein